MDQGYNPKIDYYQILGVGSTATTIAIKRAYHGLARRFHPDKTGGDLRKAEHFKLVLEAYEVLTDPFVKHNYDDARKFSGFGYHTPVHDEDDAEFKPKKPKKASSRRKKAKPKTKPSEASTEESQLPPEFRTRARSTYSYTYPPSKTSPDPNDPPKSSTDSYSESEAEPEECPGNKEPCKNFTFKNYYYKNFTERQLLPDLRVTKLQTLRAWRLAKNQTADAKFNMDFPELGGDVETLRGSWEDRKRTERELHREKLDAGYRCDEHERRAKIVMQEERAKGSRY